MKKYLIFILLASLFVACSQSKEELIQGKWKIADITSPKPNIPDSLNAYYEDQLEMQNEELLKNGYYEFKKDGSSDFILNDQANPGQWRLDENKEHFFVKGKNEISEIDFTIKELSKNIFILESTIDGQIIRMVLKKEL